ncbi:MAG: ROK family transcriptional regulator [Bryobacterales bacterium]|nr:ROK family transcriptional regulator [Bryobacterales bacterium]
MSSVTVTSRGALRKSDLRVANERLLLNIVRQNAGISPSDVARMTGFSPSSVKLIVDRMRKRGLLAFGTRNGDSSMGRRPLALQLCPDALVAVGIEIATPLTRLVTADLNGKILKQKSVPWHANPQVLLGRVRDAMDSMTSAPTRKQSLLGAGISIPGTVDRAGGAVVAAENLGWSNVPAAALLARDSRLPIYFENNAIASALAERWFCQDGAKPLDNFVFLTTHDGLGTGVIADGKPLLGAYGEGCEFGHVTMVPDGRPCLCGNAGCWEQYSSDFALVRMYREYGGQDELTATAVVERARIGEAPALRALLEAAGYVGLGIVNLNAVLNPEAIVVDGYLSAGWDLMEQTVMKVLRRRLAPRCLARIRIVRSRHAVDAGLVGAVALVLTRFFTQFHAQSH